MPSIEDKMCILNNSTVSKDSPSTSQSQSDFLSKDMENLVSEIKENLKLTNLKVKNQRRSVRCKPYTKPSRSCDDTMDCDMKSCITSKSQCSHSSTSRRCCASTGHLEGDKFKESSDNPYEMLQELLKDGSLIKEAVRRLQKGLSPKQRYFYESEDDSARSSPHHNLDFVC
uniref:Uncharacterized protein n=1 Tax=Cacopsylla melanoneura TaxID=428564 RepID=A0A8D8WWV0_9HEMI